MTKQPEALRLAEVMDGCYPHIIFTASTEAAAELRRLYEVNAELLAALKAIEAFIPKTRFLDGGAAQYSANVLAADKVRAAIMKATGENHG